jgi:DNA-binding NarL/FixJ family response regulator
MVEPCLNSRVPTEAKIRIAIADDHPIFRNGLASLLSVEQDFDVVVKVEEWVESLGSISAI